MLGLKTTAMVSGAALLVFGVLGCTEENGPATASTSGETSAADATPDNAESGEMIEGFKGQKFRVISTHTLESGIVVEELFIGEGSECPVGATVTMDYHGTFLDGSMFDSTRGKSPLTDWALTRFIEGWQLGVPGMKTGGVRRLTIPYQYAYGEAGRGTIPPKSDLVFVIQLVSFKQ